MGGAVRRLLVFAVRQCVLWAVDALALGLTAYLLSGFTIQGTADTPAWLIAVAAAFVLGLVNLLIRPVILVVARPLGMVALLVVGFLVNAVTLLIAADLLPGFTIDGVWPAFVGSLLFVALNTIITTVMELDEEGSYYEGRMERWAAREPFEGASEPGVGLVMIEIDGLSYHHLRHALDSGYLPTLSQMVEEEGYELSRADCGIPSMTSSCQAGIMFGDNYDIPAFRWYDKDEQRLYVSHRDAALINARYAKGEGLMRKGSSIDNMMDGDAEKSMLTLADLTTKDRERRRRRSRDIYLLALNPYFLTRTLVLAVGNAGREVWEGWRQRRRNEFPRLNRLAHLYPFVRAATCVLVRDLAAQLTVLDIIRGAPSIYVCWPGYDEVAHHSGPWSRDAFGELARFDAVVSRVRRVIREKAPRPYELVLLSDHGQSFGATFSQRYDLTLKEFIEQQLPEGTRVEQAIGGDTGVTTLSATSAELGQAAEEGMGGGLGRAVSRQGQRVIDRSILEQDPVVPVEETEVTAYGSGNLAQVYFNLYNRKITLPELEAAYPGMVAALVGHEGIGFVAGYEEGGTPVVLGKGGRRNLHTGEVTGKDPLAAFARDDGYGSGDIEKRVWQTRRVMDFPHAGDLMVNSTVYPDGTVAAFEELIGSHGGMGGEQTDAFVLHPPSITVPDTRNSTDLYQVLNGRRGGEPRPPAEPAAEDYGVSWSWDNLSMGALRVRYWGVTALRCLTLDRSGYERAASDPTLTGPAVLIALATLALTGWALADNFRAWSIPAAIGLWLAATAAVWGVGGAFGLHVGYGRVFRTMAFARTVHIVEVLVVVGFAGSLIRFLGLALGLAAVWMAVAVALRTRGLRALFVGLVGVLVVVGGLALLGVLAAGADVALQGMAEQLGLGGR